jgi:hypothetical protein
MFEEALLDNHGLIIILVLGPLVRTDSWSGFHTRRNPGSLWRIQGGITLEAVS